MNTGDNLALLTDLYQLTMAQGYFREQRVAPGDLSAFLFAPIPQPRAISFRRVFRMSWNYLEQFP